MEGSLLQFLENGLNPQPWRRYQSFTSAFALPVLPVFPVSQEKVALFITFLGHQGLAVATIESYLAGLRYYNIRSDPLNMFPSLYSPYIKLLLRGVQRAHSQKRATLIRLPITSTVMARIKAALALDPSNYQNILTWAACCIGFFGFLRAGEFITPDGSPYDANLHLSIADISFHQTGEIQFFQLLIKGSKTDQFRAGCTVVLGATHTHICPVAALADYLHRQGNSPGPLFRHEDGSPLRRRQFVNQVQSALMTAGLPGADFNGHSFRIGAATAASHARIPETTIKILGRWNSMAYQRFIRPSSSELASIAGKLVGSPRSDAEEVGVSSSSRPPKGGSLD